MIRLFDHLKDTYLNEPFEEDMVFYDITIYTNEDYAADNIFAHTKDIAMIQNGRIQQNN